MNVSAPLPRKLLFAIAPLCLAACGSGTPEQSVEQAVAGKAIPMAYAKTFKVVERDGYRVVDLKASMIAWGGAAVGPEEFVRLVLVPRAATPPPLTGDLAGATLVRTPAMRIATNLAPFEAMLRALGIEDRLVAVGGAKSWDDAIRAKALAGQIAQVGYGWHSPPNLDALVAAKPDLFLMSMGATEFSETFDRVRSLGIPTVPIFLDAEPDYMGDVDYIRLVGMLTGREREADAYVAKVAASVTALKAAAAKQPRRTVISAWFSGGDRWMATIRNADAAMLRDAGGINPLSQPDDNRQDSFTRIGTEAMLEKGRDAECWILRDTLSEPFTDIGTLKQFRAYREDCLFASDGMTKPRADAFDLYETAVIRPDLVLGDLVRMLHPPLRTEPFRYVRPDTKVAR